MGKINADMVIADIIEKYPVAAEVMAKHGLSCFGCHANPHETLKVGAAAHGMEEDKIELIIKEINEAIEKEPEPVEDEKKEIVPLKLTSIAIAKLKELRKESNKDDCAVRISVVSGGCAGYSYGMDFDKNQRDDDKVLEFDDLKVYVDPRSYEQLSAVEIDYLETLSDSGFKFNNPNAQSSCGCGKSFR